MSFKILVKPEAELDAVESALWYNGQSEGLGIKFLEALGLEIQRIKSNPKLFRVKYRQTRVSHVDRFPYGIHYKIEGETIVVLAILHTSRNPQIWKDRQEK